jgi:hypothetical protein
MPADGTRAARYSATISARLASRAAAAQNLADFSRLRNIQTKIMSVRG